MNGLLRKMLTLFDPKFVTDTMLGRRKRGMRLEGRDPTLSSSKILRNRNCDPRDNITLACVKSIDEFIKWFEIKPKI